MNKHDLYMLSQYLVLASAIGTYGAVTGVWAVQYVGGIAATFSVWYGARAGLRAYMDAEALDWEPLNYGVIHYTGVMMATLGVLGFIQYHEGVIWQSLAGVLLGLGAACASAGLYERYKREATHS